jgi:GDSL-like Lipase/Acylhydrolase family
MRIRDEQVPQAEVMRPDLVGITAGGNDIIGFRCEVAQLSRELHRMLARLVRTAATVVVFTGFDPRGRLPMGRVLARRAASYNASIRESSAELGVHVVDLWNMPGLYDDQMWAQDRLHLSPDGHLLVAAEVLQVIGMLPSHDALAARSPAASPAWLSARRADAEWFGSYFAPWFARKVRGRSVGDLLEPKLPQLTRVPALECEEQA